MSKIKFIPKTAKALAVQDILPPVITLAGSNPVYIEQNETYVDAGATALDAEDGDVNVSVLGSVDNLVVGQNTLTYIATDKAGNRSTATRIVNVTDAMPPVISVTGSNPMYIKQGATYTELGATALDNVDGNVTVTITGTVSTQNLGTNTITYTATDKLGNSSTATRIVNVTDAMPPVITVTGANPMYLRQNVAYTELGATALDNVDGNVTVTITGTVNKNVVGSNTITYTATDKRGNSSTATRIINVTDAVPPVITLAGSNPLYIGQLENYVEAGATSLDAEDGTVTVSISGSVDNLVVGPNTITYTATDAAGNSSTATRIVNVTDTTPPVITVTGPNPLTLRRTATFDDPGATAVDNVDETVSIVTSGTVDTQVVGQNTITYTATDAANNVSVATREVQVLSNGLKAQVISSGNHNLALIDGEIWTEGSSFEGGQGREIPAPGIYYTQKSLPWGPTGIMATAISASRTNSLAIVDGVVWTTGGYRQGIGQGILGDCNALAWTSTGLPATAIAAGGYRNLAISNGEIWVLGPQYANNTAGWGYIWRPTGLTATAISTSSTHALAIREGEVWAIGSNGYGQLGLGDTEDRTEWTPTGIMATAIAAGSSHSLALVDGVVYVAGRNDYGQLGFENIDKMTSWISTGLQATDIEAGDSAASYAIVFGEVWSTGYNLYGQLGREGAVDQYSWGPTGIMATAISASTYRLLALKPDGTLISTLHYSEFSQLPYGLEEMEAGADVLPPVLSLSGYNPMASPLTVPFVDPGATAWDIDSKEDVTVTVTGEVNPFYVAGIDTLTYTAMDNAGNEVSRTRDVYILNNGLTATSVATSRYFTLAIVNGEVWSVGRNNYGQLGREGTTDQIVWGPTGIMATAIAAGAEFSLALVDGVIWGVGNNQFGQIERWYSVTKTWTSTGIAATDIAAGDQHSLAIVDGVVWSAGADYNGQLCRKMKSLDREGQTWTTTGLTATAISASGNCNLAIHDGVVFRGGEYGAAPVGTANRIIRYWSSTGLPATAIAAGSRHSLAISDGVVWSEGHNDYGQLGRPSSADLATWESTGLTATAISVGRYGSAAVHEGEVWTVGYNIGGQLGRTGDSTIWGTTGQSATSVYVTDYNVLALDAGEIKTLGPGYYQPFGPAVITDTTPPVITLQGPNPITLTRGNSYIEYGARALDSEDGQLDVIARGHVKTSVVGTDTITYTATDSAGNVTVATREVNVLSNGQVATKVSSGNYHSLAIVNGMLWVIGQNSQGQLGTGGNTTATQWVNTNIPVTDVSAGGLHSLIIRDGVIWSTGYNTKGQLGRAGTTNQTYWGSTGITATAIAAGGLHSLAIQNGILWSTGSNSSGELGRADTPQGYAWTWASTGISVTAVSAGSYHTLVIREGEVWAVGANSYGQLGLGDNAVHNTLTSTGLQATAIEAGNAFSLALVNGEICSTGDNSYGQLGVGDTDNRNSWVSTGIQATAISAGYVHSLAIVEGYVWSAGSNSAGRLGRAGYDAHSSGGWPSVGDVHLFKRTEAQASAICAGSYGSYAIREGVIWTTTAHYWLPML